MRTTRGQAAVPVVGFKLAESVDLSSITTPSVTTLATANSGTATVTAEFVVRICGLYDTNTKPNWDLEKSGLPQLVAQDYS